MATQLTGLVMPIPQVVRKDKARAITDEDKKNSVFRALRSARAGQRLHGIRAKKAAEEADAKK